ncbi:glycosyl hydrolase [Edaphobacter modestus]|uniref:Alpha-L-rhamnosidase-like protein n=1 Tax=Edaphobacter modestus TaxID=388466 RepID=A0A4Q7YT54_9BACT|nr:glycosyl hydrolase [Edaphobacter modestus]RZU40055.1 alpha-L-rhamnosidase-like protein [Edaphobacter modestus]
MNRIAGVPGGRIVSAMLAAAMGMAAYTAPLQGQQSVDQLRREFANPPNDARPMVRWWWFGPAVSKEEISREIHQMHEGGFGGFELASVYPLALDDPQKGIRNLRYASPEMVDMLRFAREQGSALGMRVDLTLGSGWPFGGPQIPIDQAAGRLKIVAAALPVNQLSELAEGDTPVAAFLAKGTPEHYDTATAKQIQFPENSSSLPAANTGEPQILLLFINSHTRQMVKRAAVGGEGFVLDHMSREAIDTHLQTVGDALLKGFVDAPPYAIFSDSLEVYGSDWTRQLPEEFKKRRGYDLIPHLPELAAGVTPEAEAIRHDWGVTLSDLVRENYLKPLADYATAHHTRFRSQTYGSPAATLSDERIPQLPEGEGPQWDRFSFTRWTSSANHLFGNNVTSAETWTWLHSPAFRATPLDMKAEADRMFVEGVNQIIGHGWPYSPSYATEPGYSLYAAAVFNAHNPWYAVMPDVTRYLQRVSWMLRQGEPANDVALLLPEDDAQADFRPGHVSVTDEMKTKITPALMRAILGSGHNVDYVDGSALYDLHKHPLLIVPPTKRIRLKAAEGIAAYAKSGGKVIFIGTTPSVAPGVKDAKDTPEIQKVMAQLISSSAHISNEDELPGAIDRLVRPDLDVHTASGAIGFLHRHLQDADVYFIANVSSSPQTLPLHTGSTYTTAEWWSPEDGTVIAAERERPFTLEPYGSRLLVLHGGSAPAGVLKPKDLVASTVAPIALSHWSAEFPGSKGSPALPTQTDAKTMWTDEASEKFYSGEVRYRAGFRSAAPKTGEHLLLHFAEGKALPDTQPEGRNGMRAWYDAPIREAAVVFLNGERVGSLWHPPYELDLTKFIHAGENTVEIRVYNTGINELAGQPPRDYTALKAKYGDRFQMQDMEDLQPVPSGISGPVQIVYRTERSLP